MRRLLVGCVIVFALSACTTASESPTSVVEAGGLEVSIVNFAFEPSSIEVSVGDKVAFVNDGASSHTSTAAEGLWDSGTLAPGDRFEVEVTEAGELAFFCAIHPSMMGTITANG